MSRAFEAMRNEIWGRRGDRSNVRDLLLFMTDGFPSARYDPTRIAKDMREIDGIRIMGIGATGAVDPKKMAGVVSEPFDANFVTVKEYYLLQGKIEEIIRKTCFKNKTERKLHFQRLLLALPKTDSKCKCQMQNVRHLE